MCDEFSDSHFLCKNAVDQGLKVKMLSVGEITIQTRSYHVYSSLRDFACGPTPVED